MFWKGGMPMFRGRTKGGRKATGKAGRKTPRGPVGTPRRLFHAVSIKPRDGCECDAASQQRELRFLSDEAPQLPLDGCDRPTECRCVFVHYDDRRTAIRREADEGLPERRVELEQRTGTGRRITDR